MLKYILFAIVLGSALSAATPIVDVCGPLLKVQKGDAKSIIIAGECVERLVTTKSIWKLALHGNAGEAADSVLGSMTVDFGYEDISKNIKELASEEYTKELYESLAEELKPVCEDFVAKVDLVHAYLNHCSSILSKDVLTHVAKEDENIAKVIILFKTCKIQH